MLPKTSVVPRWQRLSGGRASGRRRRRRGGWVPPEQWFEPTGRGIEALRFVVEPPGAGFRHPVTVAEVRQRLQSLPAWMTRSLEVVKFSRMTHKRRTEPCYGMQWGCAIYLYPVEADGVEWFRKPPLPCQQIEAAMYGARWEQDGQWWKLVWTPEALRDFYLNNVLIHELAHLLDKRNRKAEDRERFANWFAIQYGYLPKRRLAQGGTARPCVRRHGR